MKVAIIGSRALRDDIYAVLERAVPPNATEIISGGAVGVDALAERYAKQNGLPLRVFLPEYDLYAGRAPLVRNAQIVDASDFVLIVWNGHSRGTANVIMSCIRKNKPFQTLMIK